MKLRGSRRGRRRLIIVLLFLLLASVFTFRGVVARIIEPSSVQLTEAATWIYERVFWFVTAGEITPEELEVLYEQRDALAIDKAAFEELQIKHAETLALLGYRDRTETEGIVAQIMAKTISGTTATFVITVGEDDGVTVGDPVIVGGGILLGKIASTGSTTSTVTALTDTGYATAVTLFNESRTIGMASGTIGDLLEITFIPTDEFLEPNMIVVTSGLEESVPSGLLVGVINTVQEDQTSPFQTAIVEPLADMRRASSVLVLPQQSYD